MNINPVMDFYVNLKTHLGLEIDEEIKPNSAMEVIPHPRVLSTLDIDLISVKLGGVMHNKKKIRMTAWQRMNGG